MLTQKALDLRRYKQLFILVILVYLIESNVAMITEEVYRRPSGDSYRLYNSNRPSLCRDNDEKTYLVGDGRCIGNEELMNSCSFYIAPVDEVGISGALLKITNGTSLDVQLYDIVQMRASTFNFSDDQTEYDAVIEYSGRVANCGCFITHLEVYRGSRQVFVISYEGLSLNERGNIEINESKLAYGFEEYLGELFRMNLSCTGGGLPDSGCVFFKVLGRANVTYAKFEGMVPGTIYGEVEPTNTSNIHGVANLDSTSWTTTSKSNPSASSPGQGASDGNYLTYIAVSGSLVGALLIIVILLCIILLYCCLTPKKNVQQRSIVITAEKLWCGEKDLITMQNEQQQDSHYPCEENTETSAG